MTTKATAGITMRFPAALKRRLVRHAAKTGSTLTGVLIEAAEALLAQAAKDKAS